MKRVFVRLLAILLASALILPVSAAEAPETAEPCDAAKVTVLLLPREGTPLSAAAAAVAMAVDDYALTPAGRASAGAADRLLDGIFAAADDAAHCCRETARWTAALLGLAVEVDAADIPYLRAAGDTAPVGARFDVHRPAHYLALDPDAEAAPTFDAVPDSDEAAAAPDLIVNVTESPLPAAGDGTVIAILDSGFDADAAWLTLPEHASPALAGDALAARLKLIGRTPSDEGQNAAKVPFLYNYAAPDTEVGELAAHGTRVAALAAAHRGDEYDGTAPGAQLLLMKVFGGATLAEGADEDAILSALDDAILLGADVINLSFGFPAGDAGTGEGLSRAVAGAQAVGIGIVAAAGSSAETGAGSFFYSRTGQPLFPTDHPDRGTVAAPASLPGVISVGSAAGSYTAAASLYDAEGNRIRYTDTSAEYFVNAQGHARDFAALIGVNEFRYVTVRGVGIASDYAELDVAGCVALVPRGAISFAEKTQHAAAAGAIGVIVYDNDPETDGAVNMQLDGAALPAIFINIADGNRLAEADSGTLSFPDRDLSTRGSTVQAVSASSARGMTDDFRFAPTLVALGENFVGLAPDNRIAILDGSSYAAPQVSGALAILLRELRAEGMGDVEALDGARALLQNSALPLDAEGERDIPVSVRVQGAGVLDLAAAQDSPLLLTANDSGAFTATGAGAQFDLTFTVTNRTDRDLAVTLRPTLYADAYRDPLADEPEEIRTQAGEEWLALCGYSRGERYFCTDGSLTPLASTVTLDGTSIGETGARIRLDAGERREITLTVTLDADAHAAYTDAFPYGFTVEGRVTAEADAAELSLPFAVFCGDWSAAPIAAPTAYDEAEQLFLGQAVSAQLISGYTVSLGQMQGGSVSQNLVEYRSELAAINASGLAGPMTLDVSLLRNVASYTVTVTDAQGEVVYTALGGGLRKSYSLDGGTVIERIPLWDGSVTDNPKYICPDGVYTVTLTLTGEAGGTQTLTLPLCLDSTPPELFSATFRHEPDRLMLDLRLTDAEYIRTVIVLDRGGHVDYDYSFFDTVRVLDRGRNATVALSIDVTGLFRQYFYVTVTDYAYNTVTVRLDREALFAAAEGAG